MVRSAYVYGLVRRAGEFGVSAREVGIDWPAVIERKDRIVRQLGAGRQAELEARGIDVFRRRAAFVSPNEMDLEGQHVRAGKIVLAVGSHPARPPIPGLEMAITSDQALDLGHLPPSVAIIGGGTTGIEFAHAWNAAGAHVTILELGSTILAPEDGEIKEALTAMSRARGIEIHTGARVRAVERAGEGYAVLAQTPAGDQRFAARLVMVATGRVANTEGLRLEEAGVEAGERGISINEYLQTTAPHIYAAGDATGRHFLTPVASYEGRLAARNALQGNHERADYSVVPHAVYTLPPAASVGLREEEARQAGLDVAVSRVSFASSGRAVIDDESEGLVKLVLERGSGRLLGAHLLTTGAEELIHSFAIAMRAGLTQEDLARMIPVHPTLSEGAIKAAVSAEMARAESRCG